MLCDALKLRSSRKGDVRIRRLHPAARDKRRLSRPDKAIPLSNSASSPTRDTFLRVPSISPSLAEESAGVELRREAASNEAREKITPAGDRFVRERPRRHATRDQLLRERRNNQIRLVGQLLPNGKANKRVYASSSLYLM